MKDPIEKTEQIIQEHKVIIDYNTGKCCVDKSDR